MREPAAVFDRLYREIRPKSEVSDEDYDLARPPSFLIIVIPMQS